MTKYGSELKSNQNLVSLLDFMKLYNASLPDAFPKVSKKLLGKYQSEHTELFKHGELWSIDLHRKKVLDWMPSQLRAS